LSSEKLLTKFNGFWISCAIPAVSCPSEAIFSERINFDWVDLSWVNVFFQFSFLI
jgi:hypothetical protein